MSAPPDARKGLDEPPTYSGQCGEPVGGAEHAACARRAELEPPRYCAVCRRRMKVQVVPRGWLARCSVHGDIDARPDEEEPA